MSLLNIQAYWLSLTSISDVQEGTLTTVGDGAYVILMFHASPWREKSLTFSR